MTKNKRDPYELLTRGEAAEALRIHISTLTKLTTSGELPSVRLGGRVMIARGYLEGFIRGEEPDWLQEPDSPLGTRTRSLFAEEDRP